MTRVLSAVVLIALLFSTVWLLPWWATAVLAAAAAAQAASEMAGLAAAAGVTVPSGFMALSAASVTTAFAMHDATSGIGGGDALAPVLLAMVVGAGVVTLASGPPSPATLTRAAVMCMTPMYVGLPIGALVWIALSAGPHALTWLIVVIGASDSAQYYSGRAFGRRKLAPAVSPAKTVEGALGGLAAAAIAAPLAGAWWLPGTSLPAAAVLGLLLAAFGMAGDLFESLLKRSAGVKDSSALIPGHGGLLDRLDSYLFSAPCFYVFLRYVQ
jgi:phosphatidate cytidylyltransferase